MSASAALLQDPHDAWSHDMGRAVTHFVQNFQSRRLVCQDLPANQFFQNDLSHNSAEPLQLNAPSSSPHQSGAESDVPQLEQNPQVLKDRIRNAMKRRVGPGTGLTVKMVARATGLTERTIENASSGTIPRGDTLMALLDFFDASFANEIFAGATFMVVKLSDHRAADAARQINEGVATLQALARGR